MARNVEKEKSMLNQWLKLKDVDHRNVIFKIPKNVESVDDLEKAITCRNHLKKELCRKITEIQNYTLSDQCIRDINDQINKLIYIKRKWEIRIVELGGPDYRKESDELIKANSVELKGNNNYKYFGAAKNLKGVKELLHRQKEERQNEFLQKKRETQNKEYMADAFYYGYSEYGQSALHDEEEAATTRLMIRDIKTLKRMRRSKNNNQSETCV